jgi:DNA-binding CsgD family transcriptional regulator
VLATVASLAIPAWVDRIGVPAWVTGADRAILYLNPRAESLFQCSASECVGRVCYEALGARGLWVSGRGTLRPFCGSRCAVQNSLERGRELPAVDACLVRSGELQWIHLLPIPVRGEDGTTLVVHCALPADREHRLEAYVAHVAGRSPHPPCPACLLALSRRESEVLRLLAEDLTLGEIAERLGVSYVTVRNHVQHMLAKLGVHSTAEAIAVFLLDEPADQKSTTSPSRCVSPRASGSNR